MRIQMWLFLIVIGMLAMACSSSNGPTFVPEDGDEVEDSDSDADGDVADGDGQEDGDVDGDEDADADGPPSGTKCDIDRHDPDRVIEARAGGAAQICIPDDPLDGVRVRVERGVLLDDVHVTISEVDSFNVDGWTTIGPAIQFKATPAEDNGRVVLGDDATFVIPLNMDEMTEYARDFHVNVLVQLDPDNGATSGDGNPPFFIAKTPTSIIVDHNKALVSFENTYFGTYQVAIPSEILPPTTRRFTYKGFAGISMGCFPAAITGFRFPEKFDLLGPMGGVMDTAYLLQMIYRSHLGGFCPLEEIEAQPDLEAFLTDETYPCGYCGPQRDPEDWSNPVDKCYMVEPDPRYPDDHAQGFNHWYYDDNGGSFDRVEYVKLFRDLVYAYGNFTNYNPDSPYLTAGLTPERMATYVANAYVPDETSPMECEFLAQWMAEDPILDFYDNEYNPEAQYPVIAFCDGSTEDAGDWKPGTDPKARYNHLDIGLAVDMNGNGVRDYGEPVIRQFWEPWQDCGTDGLCNADEPGYDAATNPDPAGDDYDPYVTHDTYNPLGTEGNGLFEDGEPYEDLGLDGVACPERAECPYDYGEGNGQFDYNPNVKHILSMNPRQQIRDMNIDELKRLNVWMDAGIRDLFNFVIHGDNITGALESRLGEYDLHTNPFQRFTSLMLPEPDDLGKFRFLKVDYGKLGHNVMMRYGDYNATDATILAGDGRHVGYPSQVVFRIQTFYSFANYHFPNGDTEPVDSYNFNDLMLKDRYYSKSLDRLQKYSIVLPPGYYRNNEDGADGAPDICNDRYPVIYLAHGYGMEPEDMAAAIPILFGYMSEGIFQKIITVFPDGKCDSPGQCRSDCNSDCSTSPDMVQCRADCEAANDCDNVHRECLRGTFYADHVATGDLPISATDPEGGFTYGKIEQSMFDLMEFVDENYCTKSEEVVEVDGATLDGLY